MSYRDDRDADRARIEALEAELAAAKREIAELEGRRDNALVLASGGALVPGGKPSAAARWFGGPLELSMTREFDGEFPADKFEQLIAVMRTRSSDPGRSEVMKSSLMWSMTPFAKSTGPFTSLMVVVANGKTTLTARDRTGQLAGALYGGVLGGVGGGGISLPIFASIAVPMLAPVFVVGWLGGTFLGTRALFKRAVRKRAEHMQRLFDAVAKEIERALPR